MGIKFGYGSVMEPSNGNLAVIVIPNSDDFIKEIRTITASYFPVCNDPAQLINPVALPAADNIALGRLIVGVYQGNIVNTTAAIPVPFTGEPDNDQTTLMQANNLKSIIFDVGLKGAGPHHFDFTEDSYLVGQRDEILIVILFSSYNYGNLIPAFPGYYAKTLNVTGKYTYADRDKLLRRGKDSVL